MFHTDTSNTSDLIKLSDLLAVPRRPNHRVSEAILEPQNLIECELFIVLMLMQRKTSDFHETLSASLATIGTFRKELGAALDLLDRDPFPPRALNVDEVEEWFKDREGDLTALFKVLTIARAEKPSRFALVGPPGIGKTSLLSAVSRALEARRGDIESQIGGKIRVQVDSLESLIPQSSEDGEEMEEGHPFFRYLGSLHPETDLLVLDDCDRSWRVLPEMLSRLAYHRPRLAILLVLTITSWRGLLKESQFLESLTTSSIVRPMSRPQIIDLLSARLRDSRAIDDDALERIGTASGGVPGFAVRLARRSLLLAKQRTLAKVTEAFVEEVAPTTPTLESAEASHKKLTKIELEIADTFLDSWEGMNADEVADRWRIDRSTAVGHLTAMWEKGALTRTRYGRRVKYRLGEDLRVKLEIDAAREWM